MGGTGLGLSISKRFAEMMGGGITVVSKQNQGSQFSVNIKVKRSVMETIESSPNLKKVSGLADPDSAPFTLIVDDNKFNREFLKYALKSYGFHTEEAIDGEDAVEIFSRDRPQLILMDIVMERLGGIDAAQKIRTLDGGEDAKIIAITASVMEDEVDREKNCGVDEVIFKPVNIDQLLHVIAKLTGLELLYADSLDDDRGAIGSVGKDALTPEDIKSFPEELVDKISGAVMTGKISYLRELVDPVADWDEKSGLEFEFLVRNFRMKELKRLFCQKGE